MRINKYIASSTPLSRRAADDAIEAGRVLVNGRSPSSGQDITDTDTVTLDGRPITPRVKTTLLMINKPVGCVVSTEGQGSKTVYDILPNEYRHLRPIGRLDKNSSGLLLLTDDGELAQELSHPRYAKQKIYTLTLLKPLEPLHQQMISDHGIKLDDGPSQLSLERLDDTRLKWQVAMAEGRNRQIRRTFEAVGYTVNTLHRTQFGPYSLGDLAAGEFRILSMTES